MKNLVIVPGYFWRFTRKQTVIKCSSSLYKLVGCRIEFTSSVEYSSRFSSASASLLTILGSLWSNRNFVFPSPPYECYLSTTRTTWAFPFCNLLWVTIVVYSSGLLFQIHFMSFLRRNKCNFTSDKGFALFKMIFYLLFIHISEFAEYFFYFIGNLSFNKFSPNRIWYF